MEKRDYVTVVEAAEALDVSTVAVQNWCRSGKLASYRVGRAYRIPREAFEALSKGRSDQPKTIDIGRTFDVELSALVQAWLWDMEHGPRPYSKETIRTHRMHLYKFVRTLIGNEPDAHLKYHEAINEKALLRVFARIPVAQFATRYNVYMAVMSLCNFLIRQGVLGEEMKATMKPHKPRRLLPPKRTCLHTLADVNRFLEALWMTEEYSTYEKRLNAALIGTMVFAGLRVSEVANLELADIDFTYQIIHIRNGKGGKARMVGINKRLHSFIEDYLCMRPGSDSGRLYLAKKGTALNRDYIIRRLVRLSKRSGMPISAHGLRRTFATLNANAGRSINLIQLALGHADLSTTQAYLMADQRVAAREMQDW